MLAGQSSISSVSVEDPEGGAFDDVVVRRTSEPNLYIQAKSSNYAATIINGEWLTTSRSPKGRSPLQKFYDTCTTMIERGDRFSLALWTNRGFDNQNPLLGLRDNKHDKIQTGNMLAASPNSSIGKEREAWIEHLRITDLEITAEKLADFLEVLSWKYTGSELEIRERAIPYMTLAGLRADDAAVDLGIAIVRDWVSDGHRRQKAVDVYRHAAERGLVAEQPHSRISRPAGNREPTSIVDAQTLPPGCRACIRELLEKSPADADRVRDKLEHPLSRLPGVLAHFADNPPKWLQDANALAWDAIASFADAHELSDYESLRAKAIEKGSLREPFYLVLDALRATDVQELERARDLLKQIPQAYPLYKIVETRINDNDRALVNAIRGSRLHESQEPEISRPAIAVLALAYVRLDEIPQALAILVQASQRFPEYAWYHLCFAEVALTESIRRIDRGIEHTELLRSAVEHALQARDKTREWHGRSGNAVAVASTAMLLLNDAAGVCNLASTSPEGEATPEETRHPEVVKCLANALLRLNRGDRLEEIDIALLDARERAHFIAQRAYGRGDPDAKALMQNALEQATDDEMRLKAHYGLALFGELDETSLAAISTADDVDKDFIRAWAYYSREDYDTAISYTTPHYGQSASHAELLALVQSANGATDEAVETLTTAAESLGAVHLYAAAVELRIDEDNLRAGEALATTALANVLPSIIERDIRFKLVDIANRMADWQVMESRARSLFDKFPSAPLAPWTVVHALVCQVRPKDAWDFLIEKDLSPFDEQTALIAIQVYYAMSSSEVVAQRLLDIASEFAESREVAGAALGALMMIRGQATFTEIQRSRYSSMLSSYLERFPESEVLRAVEFDSLNELLRNPDSVEEARATMIAEFANSVRNGNAPYGMLTAIVTRPYAELLLSVATGYLTAISPDEAQRARERAVAREAMSGDVSVDTSVAAVGIRATLPLDALTSSFGRILISNGLVYDARATVASISVPISGYLTDAHAPGGPSFTEVTEEEREQMEDWAGRLVEILEGWHNVPTSRLTSPLNIDNGRLRTWDASLRVAVDRQCALWCDDLALRRLAESVGIPTFGSYALVEVLAEEDRSEGLPSVTEFKRDLLCAGIADVPLTWGELSELTEAEESSDLAAIRALDRPLSWTTPMTLTWYNGRVEALASDLDHNRLLELVRAACCGRGMSVAPSDRETAIGEVVATTLNTVRLHAVDPAEWIPGILEASRYACGQIDPSGQLEVLREAVTVLRNWLITQFGPALAASVVTKLFAQTPEADRNIVASVILDAGD